MQEPASKVAVVIGAASGIGLELGRIFGERDLKIIAADIGQKALDRAVGELLDTGWR